MIAIRGATTVAADTPEEIRGAVKELLETVAQRNLLKEEEMICILFSTTADLTSFYAAKAAREAGFVLPALYSSLEPEIDGSLPMCIRIMILAERQGKPMHVYLREAKKLRKDLSAKLTIALDGPAGSGKSTIAKRLAQIYDILYLDTGAMYRAAALFLQRKGVSLKDEKVVSEHIASLPLVVEYRDGKQVTKLGEEDVSSLIRTPQVSAGASDVATHASVRAKMVELQREIARGQSCVVDGRDIGSVVLPDASFKFFIQASSDVRARRRVADLTAMGEKADFATIKQGIEERDYQDMHRAISPLRQAEDAILIDTSNDTVEETIRTIQKKIQEKI